MTLHAYVLIWTCKHFKTILRSVHVIVDNQSISLLTKQVKKVDILISKNQVLQILWIRTLIKSMKI